MKLLDQLADMLQLHKSAISVRLKNLTDNGLVKVERMEHNTIITVIPITPTVKEIVDQV
ncbi:helix-turn-helix domain-containing protein [Paenibacillus dokdonensis]|uniref:Helix-turn-helix domain-containing protein n=1 Tax=Paenibacillus dokdonensis TaxID=2567944 RepID=A0ABU6GTG3_9BACL|nr:helix-turn-helix domain-containing protein [Paenibacillus dokdonensis]MEC0242513.1 helix-turn-helix domain-containing protein [Paenibacillus dokdonensis]